MMQSTGAFNTSQYGTSGAGHASAWGSASALGYRALSRPQTPLGQTNRRPVEDGFPAFDLAAIEQANEAKRQYAARAQWEDEQYQLQVQHQHAAWSAANNPQQFSKSQPQQQTRRARQRPASAFHYHPMSYAAMRPELIKTARASVPRQECVSSRPSQTFSCAPDVYPYRFERKPEWLMPHLSQSLETRRDPPKVVPLKAAIQQAEWRVYKAATVRAK